MKKTKKNKTKKYIIPIAIALTSVLCISLALLIYIYTQNYINVEYIDKASTTVKSDEFTSATPIIINNVLVGGISDNSKWLSQNNIYGKVNITKGAEIDMYNSNGKMGAFEIHSISQDKERDITYVIPLKELAGQEYIASARSDKSIMTRKFDKVSATEEDKKYVKKALGKYNLLNNTVNVNEVYEGYLSRDQKTRVITATSSGKRKLGVYSVVVYVQNGKSKVIKYSYVKNTKSAIDWPVYSIKFACDLNNDDNYELIIQETRELTIKYSILQFKNDKYCEVIGLQFKV